MHNKIGCVVLTIFNENLLWVEIINDKYREGMWILLNMINKGRIFRKYHVTPHLPKWHLWGNAQSCSKQDPRKLQPKGITLQVMDSQNWGSCANGMSTCRTHKLCQWDCVKWQLLWSPSVICSVTQWCCSQGYNTGGFLSQTLREQV